MFRHTRAQFAHVLQDFYVLITAKLTVVVMVGGGARGSPGGLRTESLPEHPPPNKKTEDKPRLNQSINHTESLQSSGLVDSVTF